MLLVLKAFHRSTNFSHGRFPFMAVALDFDFPLQGCAMVGYLFHIDQFNRPMHPGIAGASAGIMFTDPSCGVRCPACIVSAVGAKHHITVVGHQKMLSFLFPGLDRFTGSQADEKQAELDDRLPNGNIDQIEPGHRQ